MEPLPDLKGCFVIAAVLCVLLGMILAWAIPELWALVKPWLHSLTA